MAEASRRSSNYQILLTGLLSLNFGIVFFDRNSLNFLMPFVQPELGLSDGQVGAVAGLYFIGWALNGIFPLFMAALALVGAFAALFLKETAPRVLARRQS